MTGNITSHGVQMMKWNYEYVKTPLITSLFLMGSGILKLGFHKMHRLSSLVPESCLLILVGIAFGGILKLSGEDELFQLHPRMFMLFLLPPIILDSAYSLVDRVFVENILTIMLFAVLGTVLSCFLLGPTLYILSISGGMNLDITLIECFLFASFIVAVDPVAVLAIFQDVRVNDTLYFLVFGESLLNDAVTVVLNNMMKAFVEMDDIPPSQILIGIASFFTISLGGLFIGTLFGVLTALITRTTRDLRVIEPLGILILAYLSYIVAELFHWSGIISAIGCGIVQAQYAFHNISRKSLITVHYFIKMTSSTCDSMIFLYLGIELLRNNHDWNSGFVMWSTFYCLVYRFLIVFGLSFCVNLTRPAKPISVDEQFIMWYGGLRGAVCFALCDTLKEDFRHRNMFLTTTFFIIFITVFLQGITIKPLVKLVNVKRKDENATQLLVEEINCRVIDHAMEGMEVITQQRGNFFIRNFLMKLNDNYLQRWLQYHPMTHDQKILKAYANIVMTDYEKNIKRNYMDYEEPVELYGDASTTMALMNQQGHRLSETNRHSSATSGTTRLRASPAVSTPVSLNSKSFQKLEDAHDPTVTDVRNILLHQSARSSVMHRPYDPNLKKDDMSDISGMLLEHHNQVVRAHHDNVRHNTFADDGKSWRSVTMPSVGFNKSAATQPNQLPPLVFTNYGTGTTTHLPPLVAEEGVAEKGCIEKIKEEDECASMSTWDSSTTLQQQPSEDNVSNDSGSAV